MGQAGAIAPVLTYLFHRLEARFTGRPTLLILDEAWVFLDHPLFAARIREWLKVLRKKNVSVIFATQSLADIAQSTIAPAIIESCPQRILLPMTAPSSRRAGQATNVSVLTAARSS
jgi:type IV secretion system protein VirB4